LSNPIHEDEPDTSEATVRALLSNQCPDLSDLALSYLDSSGTDNAMWRLSMPEGADRVIRLPRRPGAARSIRTEVEVLPLLAGSVLPSAVAIPTVCHAGTPTEAFGHHWAVYEWLEGEDAWTARNMFDTTDPALGEHLAGIVAMIGRLEGLPVRERSAGQRGGPLLALLDQLERWLADPQWQAERLVDVHAIRRVADQVAEVFGEPVTRGVVHGDLIPGNVLTTNGEVSAIIDWGGVGHGDLAQDLAPAWSLLESPAREAFRSHLEVDEPTWLRACAFELEHAVGGVLYYEPRSHPLGDVMRRTLNRILAAA